MASRLTPTLVKPALPSKKASRYGPARYGEMPYGYRDPAAGRPGTKAF